MANKKKASTTTKKKPVSTGARTGSGFSPLATIGTVASATSVSPWWRAKPVAPTRTLSPAVSKPLTTARAGGIAAPKASEAINMDAVKRISAKNAIRNAFPLTGPTSLGRPHFPGNKKGLGATPLVPEKSTVDRIEEKLMDRYAPKGVGISSKLNSDFGGYNDMGDAVRHAGTSMAVASDTGVVAANLLGLAHEVNVMLKDKPENFKAALKETGSDLYNNFVGSVIGGLKIPKKHKEALLKYAMNNNILSVVNK